ncbi:MAG: C25 family cysteine peptidase [Candidatus Cloacimonadaceae bacterium]|nr:C25 family cysteine peptidase [Candidatus Cloacimonadaceae bacterium]
MKNYFVMFVLLLLTAMLAAATGTIQLGTMPTSVELLRSTQDGLSIRYSIEKLSYDEVPTAEGVFTNLYVEHYTTTNKEGLPRLPLMRQLISVPVGATVVPRISSAQRKTISLAEGGIHYPIFPRQESVSKSADLSKIPFVVNRDFYNGRGWTDELSIRVEDLGFMRGERLFALDFVPVRYNPGSKEIEVIEYAEVSVSFVEGDHSATSELKAKTYSPAFEGIFSGTVINHQPIRISLNRHPMSYVIITPQAFVAALQPFIEWKTREGFNIILATTEQIGATTNGIITYMQGLWSAATTQNPAPSYLLIVGDVAQVPANTGATGAHVTDLTYVRLQGTDYMPELYYGRFSATTPAEVTNQVNKTLMHEQYTMPSDAYLSQVVMIAGVDASWSITHANGQINYGTNNYFNPAHGIQSSTYLYPASGSADAAIVQSVSAGVAYVNYTAHGSQTDWSDPTFTISNINSLQNTNKSSVVVGNCCLTNAFNTGICFGEAWLRAVNKGGVIYIGGTNNTFWDEDYWWAVGHKPPAVGAGSPFVPGRTGVYDALFHDNNEPFADWASNAGGMIVAGNLAVVQSNSTRRDYYWEIYSIMGDPSLVPYLGIPAQNSAQLSDTIFLGVSSMNIVATPFSYVAISKNNVLHGVGLADANGNLTLNFTPFSEPGTAQIVMTRSMRRPLIANIQVTPNVGPYVTISPITVIDPNANGIAEAGEIISMGLTFTNVGIADAANLSVTISSISQYVSILNNTAAIANVPAGGNITVNNLFSIQISPMIPNQTSVPFEFLITDGSNQWISSRSLTVNAPNVQIGNVTMSDANGNGFLEAGETISISFNLSNTGHMNAESGIMVLIANPNQVTLNNYSFTLPSISVGGSLPLNFVATLANNLTTGTIVPIGLAVTSGVQMINHSIMLPIGMIGEGFESNNFTGFPWVNSSPIPWLIDGNPGNAYAGIRSAKSGVISHNGTTELSVTMEVGAAGNISFWRKVSSESNYDFLRFFINGIEQAAWSGNQAWAQFSYPVQPGTRVFKWAYTKDGSVSSGSDCGWIDEIVFPMSGSGSVAMLYSPTTEITFANVLPNTTVSADFALRNLGNIALTGMISTPAGFVLSQNGINLPVYYNYSIPAGQTAVLTITHVSPSPAVNLEGEINITSNDPNNPSFVIQVNVIANTSNEDPSIPAVTKLEGNYPNPFNPETIIRFSTKDSGSVRITVYNVKGQAVRNLLSENLGAGNHKVVWNGKDNNGRSVSSGVYLYRMEAPGYNKTMKMMLMK